jgi:hypothetical protein
LGVPANFGLKDGSTIDSGKYRLILVWDDVAINNISKYLIDRSLDGTTWSQVGTTPDNAFININLEASKKYYYRVKVQDTLGSVSRPTQVLMSQPGAAPDVTAKPTITMQNWKQEYGVRATVTWDTDQSADSFVVYSKKPLQSGSATLTTDGEAAQVVGQFDKTLNHSVLVQQLEPSTKYYFKTLSQNEIKITGASEIVEVETPERVPLVLSGVEFTNTTNTATTVSWTTNKLSTTKLEYGTSTSYGSTLTDTNQNTDHTLNITNLTNGTTYHIRITSTDADGNYVTSDDYKVNIPATPTVDAIQVSEVRSSQATIKWSSNVPTDSRVQFSSTGSIPASSVIASGASEAISPQTEIAAPRSTDGSMARNDDTGGTSNSGISEQGQSDFVSSHAVTIIGLEPAKAYHYRVKSTDQFGNIAISEDKTFTTPADTLPPIISNTKSEVTTSGTGDNMKIMAIISWDTDEPATSQVEYGQGLSGEYANKTEEVTSFNMSHTVIIPGLKPNASYQYRIVSKDASNNISKSLDQTLITPTKEKSLLQLIIKSLEETFSWTKRLNQSKYVKPFIRNRK